MCCYQTPDAGISVPGVSGSLPEVSGDVSVPSVGSGLDVGVGAPSVDVGGSLPSASGDLPGESGTHWVLLARCLRAMFLLLLVIVGRGWC